MPRPIGELSAGPGGRAGAAVFCDSTPNAKSFSVRYRDKTAKNTIFIGATPEVATVMNLQMTAGRWINEADHTHNSNVVVLGHDTADTIFPANVDPVDKEVEIEGQPFRVIGVLEKRKDALQGGANPNDNVAEMPIGTFWRLHPEQKDFMFAVKTVSPGGHAAGDRSDRSAAAHPARCSAEQGRRFRDFDTGHVHGSLESDFERHFYRHACNFVDRA